MSVDPRYEMSLDEVRNFINISEKSNYRLNLIICGGEPLLWRHLEEGIELLNQSSITNRILIFSNVMNISRVNQNVIDGITELRVSQYESNKENMDFLCKEYGDKIRVVDRRGFFQQPKEPMQDVLPCDCLNQEHLYTNGKVYGCAHGAAINGGKDVTENGVELYIPLQEGYLSKMAGIRLAQAEELCTRCSSNAKIRAVLKRIPKKDRSPLKL
jgi:hypothetical protein